MLPIQNQSSLTHKHQVYLHERRLIFSIICFSKLNYQVTSHATEQFQAQVAEPGGEVSAGNCPHKILGVGAQPLYRPTRLESRSMSPRSQCTSVESRYFVAPPKAQQAYIVLSTGNSEVWTLRQRPLHGMWMSIQIRVIHVKTYTDNNDNCSAALGQKSNLRASNLQNFPGEAYPPNPPPPPACMCLRTHTNCLPPPISNVFRRCCKVQVCTYIPMLLDIF